MIFVDVEEKDNSHGGGDWSQLEGAEAAQAFSGDEDGLCDQACGVTPVRDATVET